MTALALVVIAAAATGTGLWLHDWRSIAAGAVCVFAAWLLHDVDSCITRSQAPDGSERLPPDLLAQTVSPTGGTEESG